MFSTTMLRQHPSNMTDLGGRDQAMPSYNDGGRHRGRRRGDVRHAERSEASGARVDARAPPRSRHRVFPDDRALSWHALPEDHAPDSNEKRANPSVEAVDGSARNRRGRGAPPPPPPPPRIDPQYSAQDHARIGKNKGIVKDRGGRGAPPSLPPPPPPRGHDAFLEPAATTGSRGRSSSMARTKSSQTRSSKRFDENERGRSLPITRQDYKQPSKGALPSRSKSRPRSQRVGQRQQSRRSNSSSQKEPQDIYGIMDSSMVLSQKSFKSDVNRAPPRHSRANSRGRSKPRSRNKVAPDLSSGAKDKLVPTAPKNDTTKSTEPSSYSRFMVEISDSGEVLQVLKCSRDGTVVEIIDSGDIMQLSKCAQEGTLSLNDQPSKSTQKAVAETSRRERPKESLERLQARSRSRGRSASRSKDILSGTPAKRDRSASCSRDQGPTPQGLPSIHPVLPLPRRGASSGVRSGKGRSTTSITRKTVVKSDHPDNVAQLMELSDRDESLLTRREAHEKTHDETRDVRVRAPLSSDGSNSNDNIESRLRQFSRLVSQYQATASPPRSTSSKARDGEALRSLASSTASHRGTLRSSLRSVQRDRSRSQASVRFALEDEDANPAATIQDAGKEGVETDELSLGQVTKNHAVDSLSSFGVNRDHVTSPATLGRALATENSPPDHLAPQPTRSPSRPHRAVTRDHDSDPAPVITKLRQPRNYDHINIVNNHRETTFQGEDPPTEKVLFQKGADDNATSLLTNSTVGTSVSSLNGRFEDGADDSILADLTAQVAKGDDQLTNDVFFMNSAPTMFESNCSDEESVLSEDQGLPMSLPGARTHTPEDDRKEKIEKTPRKERQSKFRRMFSRRLSSKQSTESCLHVPSTP